MAANKFATMLHRNTNKIIVVLVYAVLEWVLISFLLLNSLFGYLITKYADFFGLKRPCIWCSRVNNGGLLHNANSIAGSVCDGHAAEISKLRYCIRHERLAKSQDLCEDCSTPKWQHEEEEREIVSRCRCCNGGLNSTSYLLFKPSWCTLDYTKQGDIVIEELDGDGDGDGEEEAKKAEDGHQILSDVDSFSFREASEEEGNNNDIVLQYSTTTSKCFVEDDSVQVMDLQFMRHCSDSESLRVVPVDLIDSLMIESEQVRILTVDGAASVVEAPQEKEIKKLETNGKSGQKQEDPAPTNGDDIDVLDDADNKLEKMAATEQEAEEDRFPDTPTSLDSLHSLHKKLLLSEKRESSSMEESLEESVDGGDGVLTVDRLKSALTTERKALRALYSELEEERSASAIAANHTMAMITRLQEEKAAMQMEALQYQRMMEEQAEYDQEALQLLNELMVKREKEKEDLEKELEIYRDQDVVDDCSDDDARLSVDLNRAMIENSPGPDEDDDEQVENEDQDLEEMALDCMKHMGELDESLAEFEEERVSILDQLKALEEKLLLMSSADGKGGQGVVVVGDDDIEAAIEDGQRETMESMAKRLLTLLDEAEDESAQVEIMDYAESEKLDVVEEVDRVYERLQALEDDQEFLKNCMESATNHNEGAEQEGMNPLHEIFQHLRDLKSVELRVQSLGNA